MNKWLYIYKIPKNIIVIRIWSIFLKKSIFFIKTIFFI